MDRLEEIIKTSKKSISGKDAFLLYDTFGFPVEMTHEMAEEKGLGIDMKGFETEMENQRQRGKQSWKGLDAGLEQQFESAAKQVGDSVFLGYDADSAEGSITALYTEAGEAESFSKGTTGFLVLDQTPFYGESGGQVGDPGDIVTASGARFTVTDTKKFNKTIIHVGTLDEGSLKKGEKVTAAIDMVNRNLIRANHTATHLLQAALREVLGEHVKQAGSIVEPERLRFDFSHFNAMTETEIKEVEAIVNSRIWENIDVDTKVMSLEEATKSGAMAVFDEKYDDTVRVVTVEGFSRELCGGTHTDNTGKIGVFKIAREMSPGAGIRRIEAATLKGVLDRYGEQEILLNGATEKLNVSEADLVKRIEDLVSRTKSLEKELEKIKKASLSSGIDDIINSAVEQGGVKIVAHHFKDVDTNAMRELSDKIRQKEQASVVLFGSENEGKAMLLYAATKGAVEKGIDCGAIIKATAQLVGGGGGGRKDMAQAGGKNPKGLEEALKAAVDKAKDLVS